MDSFFHSITTLRHSSSKIIHHVLRVSTMASYIFITHRKTKFNNLALNPQVSLKKLTVPQLQTALKSTGCAACAELTSEQEYDSVAVPDSPPPSSPIPASPTPVSPTAPSPTSSPLPVLPTAASPVAVELSLVQLGVLDGSCVVKPVWMRSEKLG